MFKLAIVDDEKLCRQQVKDVLINYSGIENFIVDEFSNPNEFLLSENNYDILFLDIEMKNLDGISLANQVIKKNNSVLIFYITNYASLVTKAMNNYAFTFIPKPINENDLYMELDRACKKIKETRKIITINAKNSQILYKNVHEILFIEVQGKDCIIHMIDGSKIITNERLFRFIEKLKTYAFFQCHKSFYINLNYVLEIKSKKILLSNSIEFVPIGRKYEKELKEKFNMFMAGICI